MFLCPKCLVRSQCNATELPQEKMRKMIFLSNMVKNRKDLRPLVELVHRETLQKHRLDTDTVLDRISPLTDRCRYSH